MSNFKYRAVSHWDNKWVIQMHLKDSPEIFGLPQMYVESGSPGSRVKFDSKEDAEKYIQTTLINPVNAPGKWFS